jgi:hypothetical protein
VPPFADEPRWLVGAFQGSVSRLDRASGKHRLALWSAFGLIGCGSALSQSVAGKRAGSPDRRRFSPFPRRRSWRLASNSANHRETLRFPGPSRHSASLEACASAKLRQ